MSNLGSYVSLLFQRNSDQGNRAFHDDTPHRKHNAEGTHGSLLGLLFFEYVVSIDVSSTMAAHALRTRIRKPLLKLLMQVETSTHVICLKNPNGGYSFSSASNP